MAALKSKQEQQGYTVHPYACQPNSSQRYMIQRPTVLKLSVAKSERRDVPCMYPYYFCTIFLSHRYNPYCQLQNDRNCLAVECDRMQFIHAKIRAVKAASLLYGGETTGKLESVTGPSVGDQNFLDSEEIPILIFSYIDSQPHPQAYSPAFLKCVQH